ncbi:MAG: FAD-dependent oxidoreductase, partial [Oscillospiraceae bacterium]
VEAEIEILKDLGVQFKTGVEVGKDVTLDQLRRDGFEAFYVAIGAWKSTPIGVPGEKLKGVMAGIDFLRRTNSSRKPSIGENVAVIGGGNVAIDVARSAVRLGAKSVTVVYRRTEEEMPADEEEVAEAKAEGVKFKFLAAPVQIEGKDGKAAALKLQLMELGEPDATGRRKPVPVEGKFETLKAETVISAIGQSVEWGGLLEGSKVETGKGGVAIADTTTFQTAQPDVFVGGDVMTGPKFVIDAIAAGKEGAISIHRFVQPGQSLTLGRRKKDYAEFDKAGARIYSYDNAPRQKAKGGSAKESKETFRDLRGTFTEKQVLKETERCLGCGATVVDQAACVGCGICTTMCKFDAIKLKRVTDAAGEKYEKLLLESGKNVAKRVKNIAVRKISRPSAK